VMASTLAPKSLRRISAHQPVYYVALRAVQRLATAQSVSITDRIASTWMKL
jgi:hypothetical protein